MKAQTPRAARSIQSVKSVSAVPAAIPVEERLDYIRRVAYERYEARGCEPGHELEDWLEAESQFDLAGIDEPAQPKAA
jgi:hypothetical protein